MNKIKLKNGCYYVVEVSLTPGNLDHRAIFEYVGKSLHGENLWSPLTYESRWTLGQDGFNRFKIIEHINSMDKKVSEIMRDRIG